MSFANHYMLVFIFHSVAAFLALGFLVTYQHIVIHHIITINTGLLVIHCQVIFQLLGQLHCLYRLYPRRDKSVRPGIIT